MGNIWIGKAMLRYCIDLPLVRFMVKMGSAGNVDSTDSIKVRQNQLTGKSRRMPYATSISNEVRAYVRHNYATVTPAASWGHRCLRCKKVGGSEGMHPHCFRVNVCASALLRYAAPLFSCRLRSRWICKTTERPGFQRLKSRSFRFTSTLLSTASGILFRCFCTNLLTSFVDSDTRLWVK